MERGGSSATFAAVGDVMMTRRVSTFRDDGFGAIVQKLRDADVTIANLETLIHDFEGYPSATKTGTFMRSPSYVAEELDWCGIDVVSAATNHSFDYSYGGLETTMRELSEASIPYAGIGRNLTEARRPTYLDTPAGRVALVSACSTITPGSIAGKQSSEVKGRPGIAPLRYSVVYEVPEETYDVLRRMSEQLGLEERKKIHTNGTFTDHDPSNEDAFQLLICNGDTHPVIIEGDHYEVRLFPNRDDLRELKRQIVVANRKADFVVASLHSHEGSGASFNDQTVSEFHRTAAHNCIDGGADVFLGHGPHTFRGVEVYREAPIFYSLGNFVAQYDLIETFPPEVFESSGISTEADVIDLFEFRRKTEEENGLGSFYSNEMYWETILPLVEFGEEGLSIELHPLELSQDEPRPKRGCPVLASEERSRSILRDLRSMSERFDTEIRIEDGVGTIPVREGD